MLMVLPSSSKVSGSPSLSRRISSISPLRLNLAWFCPGLGAVRAHRLDLRCQEEAAGNRPGNPDHRPGRQDPDDGGVAGNADGNAVDNNVEGSGSGGGKGPLDGTLHLDQGQNTDAAGGPGFDGNGENFAVDDNGLGNDGKAGSELHFEPGELVRGDVDAVDDKAGGATVVIRVDPFDQRR